MRNKIIMIIITIIIILVGTQLIKNKYKNKIIEQKLITGNKPYSVYIGKIDLNDNKYSKNIIHNFNEYKQLSNHYESELFLKESDFDKYDFISIIVESDYCNSVVNGIEDITIGNEVDILVNIYGDCNVCTLQKYLYLVRVTKDSIKDKKININYQNIKNCKKE